jgi:hypothetical protein
LVNLVLLLLLIVVIVTRLLLLLLLSLPPRLLLLRHKVGREAGSLNHGSAPEGPAALLPLQGQQQRVSMLPRGTTGQLL